MQILAFLLILLGIYVLSSAACLVLGRLLNKKNHFQLLEDDFELCFIPVLNTMFLIFLVFVIIFGFLGFIIASVFDSLWKRLTPKKKLGDILRDFFFDNKQ